MWSATDFELRCGRGLFAPLYFGIDEVATLECQPNEPQRGPEHYTLPEGGYEFRGSKKLKELIKRIPRSFTAITLCVEKSEEKGVGNDEEGRDVR
jgi:hypothetical protein